MKTMEIRTHWFLWLIIAATFILSLSVYSRLPEVIPMHWNAAGEVDGYGSRLTGAFGIPLLNLGILLLLRYLPAIDPRRHNYTKFKGFYELFQWIMVFFLTGMHLLTLSWALGYRPSISLFTKLGLGILFIIIGNYMGKTRPNYFYGIKTPWTLESEEVWVKTHRLAGPLMFGAGLITIILAFINHASTFWILITIIMLASFIPVAYSYWLYRRIA